jgi:hypothetical protein
MPLYHFCPSIRTLLGLKPTNLKFYCHNGLFLLSDGRYMTVDEIKTFLNEELALGHERIRVSGCDNFDPIRGCLGHEREGER